MANQAAREAYSATPPVWAAATRRGVPLTSFEAKHGEEDEEPQGRWTRKEHSLGPCKRSSPSGRRSSPA